MKNMKVQVYQKMVYVRILCWSYQIRVKHFCRVSFINLHIDYLQLNKLFRRSAFIIILNLMSSASCVSYICESKVLTIPVFKS